MNKLALAHSAGALQVDFPQLPARRVRLQLRTEKPPSRSQGPCQTLTPKTLLLYFNEETFLHVIFWPMVETLQFGAPGDPDRIQINPEVGFSETQNCGSVEADTYL